LAVSATLKTKEKLMGNAHLQSRKKEEEKKETRHIFIKYITINNKY
jgi:hypothetical protein